MCFQATFIETSCRDGPHLWTLGIRDLFAAKVRHQRSRFAGTTGRRRNRSISSQPLARTQYRHLICVKVGSRIEPILSDIEVDPRITENDNRNPPTLEVLRCHSDRETLVRSDTRLSPAWKTICVCVTTNRPRERAQCRSSMWTADQ